MEYINLSDYFSPRNFRIVAEEERKQFHAPREIPIRIRRYVKREEIKAAFGTVNGDMYKLFYGFVTLNGKLDELFIGAKDDGDKSIDIEDAKDRFIFVFRTSSYECVKFVHRNDFFDLLNNCFMPPDTVIY